MSKMTRLYLDTCCYNRPYDAKIHQRIINETLAKMKIQKDIAAGKYELVTSVVLIMENERKSDMNGRAQILAFMNENGSYYVGTEEFVKHLSLRNHFINGGLKKMDASHLACAIISGCDYLITTDDHLSKYRDSRITIINPVDFVRFGE